MQALQHASGAGPPGSLLGRVGRGSLGAPRQRVAGSLRRNAVAERVAKGASRTGGRKGVVTMSRAPAAKGYSSALVEVGKETGTLDELHKDFESLSNVLSNDTVSTYLGSPVTPDGKKREIVKTLASNEGFCPQTVDFLNLLIDKRRIDIAKDIADLFMEMYFESSGTQVATVISVVKLEEGQAARIEEQVKKLTGAKAIKLRNVLDESLIAGFIVKYGKDESSEIDMSVKGQLAQLTAQFDDLELAMPVS